MPNSCVNLMRTESVPRGRDFSDHFLTSYRGRLHKNKISGRPRVDPRSTRSRPEILFCKMETLELFTQNYFKYGRISFTMRQRIKFWVYPPGARLFRPLPPFVQRLYIFWKILDLIQNLKKYFKHVSSHQRHRKPFTIIAPPGDDKLNKSFVEPRNLKNCHSTPSMYRSNLLLKL